MANGFERAGALMARLSGDRAVRPQFVFFDLSESLAQLFCCARIERR